MKLFFSGQGTPPYQPENVLKDTNQGRGPCLMLTHHELHLKQSGTVRRFVNIINERTGQPNPESRCYKHFLDSGAFALFAEHVIKQGLFKSLKKEKFAFYQTDEFWQRVDSYARFVKRNPEGQELYANMDVIYSPKLSWKVLKYLESEHNLEPIPVIHYGAPLEWIESHLKAGYPMIGLGGLGQGTKAEAYQIWADKVFELVCPPPLRKPIVKVHGFAMTSYRLMLRYPWWSVDSASWAKSAAFGTVYVPHKRRGEFVFSCRPYNLTMSVQSPSHKMGKHFDHFRRNRPAEHKIVMEWLEKHDIPLGSVDKHGEMKEIGVLSHYGPRMLANLWFYKRMEESMPKWPSRFEPSSYSASFNF